MLHSSLRLGVWFEQHHTVGSVCCATGWGWCRGRTGVCIYLCTVWFPGYCMSCVSDWNEGKHSVVCVSLFSFFSSVMALCRLCICVCVCMLTCILAGGSFGCVHECAAVMLAVSFTPMWCSISPSILCCVGVYSLKVWQLKREAPWHRCCPFSLSLETQTLGIGAATLCPVTGRPHPLHLQGLGRGPDYQAPAHCSRASLGNWGGLQMVGPGLASHTP